MIFFEIGILITWAVVSIYKGKRKKGVRVEKILSQRCLLFECYRDENGSLSTVLKIVFKIAMRLFESFSNTSK